MSLLWKAAKDLSNLSDDEYEDYYGHPRGGGGHLYRNYAEDHEQHSMNPAFEGAGIKHAPCAFSLCRDADQEHSDAFDEAEERFLNGDFKHGDIDLTKPVYGFEATADMHTLRRYTKHPESRQGHPPSVFIHQGRQYIHNGHHGISGALRRGDTSIPGAIVNLDED